MGHAQHQCGHIIKFVSEEYWDEEDKDDERRKVRLICVNLCNKFNEGQSEENSKDAQISDRSSSHIGLLNSAG